MNFYPFHLGDYAAHTRHLSLMEDLAYRRMLDLYYTSEAPLPADPAKVARLIGMREYMQEVTDVLSEFFVKSDAGHTSARCEREIEAHRVQARRLAELHSLNGYHAFRAAVFERDNYRCVYCGDASLHLEVDHVVPKAQGGSDSLDNLVTACRSCNRRKSGRTPEQWRAAK